VLAILRPDAGHYRRIALWETGFPATKLQNTAKNNFCAPGTPQAFTPQQLVDLQAKTKIPTGQGKEPATRAAAEALGEGKLDDRSLIN